MVQGSSEVVGGMVTPPDWSPAYARLGQVPRFSDMLPHFLLSCNATHASCRSKHDRKTPPSSLLDALAAGEISKTDDMGLASLQEVRRSSLLSAAAPLALRCPA